jgi:hypothetical protein
MTEIDYTEIVCGGDIVIDEMRRRLNGEILGYRVTSKTGGEIPCISWKFDSLEPAIDKLNELLLNSTEKPLSVSAFV